MLAVLAFATVVLSPLPAMPSDTPPPLPRAETIDRIKSREDVIAASRLADGSAAPATMVLPHLENRADVLHFMIENYPVALRGRADFEMPWAWMLVNETGRVGDAVILRTSGKAEFDSLAIASLLIARFDPALVAGKKVAVWVPMPVQIAYEDLAQNAPRDQTDDPGPTFTPYTTKPMLLNRSDVGKEFVRKYPEELRAAGVGGRTMVWILVGDSGDVLRIQIKESSGNAQIDQAALAVARVMKFSPALDRERPVQVWIALPIEFRAR